MMLYHIAVSHAGRGGARRGGGRADRGGPGAPLHRRHRDDGGYKQTIYSDNNDADLHCYVD